LHFASARPIVWDARAIQAKPKLIHLMPGNGSISGITVLGNHLFVVRGKTWRGVDVYDSTTFTFQGFLKIPESNELASIVSSEGFLFISYSKGRQLLRYDCSKPTYDHVQLNGLCRSLSKTTSGKLLVTLEKRDRYEIERMETLGNFRTVARLDSEIEPLHCIEVSDSYYLVVDSNEDKMGLYIVDTIKRIIHSYNKQKQLPFCPSHVAMDKDGFVMVTHLNGITVELLSPTLSRLGDIEVPGYKLNQPAVLYLDEVNRRLYIGESAGGRLFVLQADVGKIQ